jgi:enamine deaminase RidA (YjgF/YER057c/UK114 family)
MATMLRFAAFPLLILAAMPCAAAPALIRYPNAAKDAVTSRAVEIPAGASTVLLSGQTPTPADPKAELHSSAYWGDTEAQTRAVFAKLAGTLAGLQLDMRDVASLRIYLVGDPAHQGQPDLEGFGRAYAAVFHPQPGAPLPARTVVTVAALGHPGILIEVEAVAVRSPR